MDLSIPVARPRTISVKCHVDLSIGVRPDDTGVALELRAVTTGSEELMRHEDMDSTLKYYVGRNAVKSGAAVRAAYAANGQNVHTFVHTRDFEPETARREEAKTVW